ncbi:LamG domain-containing protein [Novipirellula artificiosorum]|uniref:LamG domain-containing protein n=1 Tax=Novipirellula artificiosorum TaxID=2528016 RepID=UPI001E48D706|nr:LamG domain-containing protein [Novipirellula artificiosorum]
MKFIVPLSLVCLVPPWSFLSAADSTATQHVATVVEVPGCVAFWDFVKREPSGSNRFVAHVPAGATNEYALDAGNYVRDYWDQGRDATYDDFPLLGSGPFGQAIRLCKESDSTFRPFLFVPRSRLHDSPLDIKGPGKSVTVVVWAIRESGNHALAGIWHEGTDLKQESTTGIKRVERGQRQYALFAGLNTPGAACGHVSENGASSFNYRYAMHKSNSGDLSPEISADSPADILADSWQCFAMTFDNQQDRLTSWLNGKATERWRENPKKTLAPVYNAWRQGELHRQPGLQVGEDTSFPIDQFYNPPEVEPVSVETVSQSEDQRVEVREYGYTRVKTTLAKDASGTFVTTDRDLVAIKLNPWWFEHDLYSPADKTGGGPFTIGRVIHSSRSVGFTGWIGGVAVFDRALSPQELARLAAISTDPVNTTR